MCYNKEGYDKSGIYSFTYEMTTHKGEHAGVTRNVTSVFKYLIKGVVCFFQYD